MRKVMLAVFLGAILAGCGGSPEEKQVDLMNDVADELEGVTDEASAQAAAERIAEIAKELEALARDMTTDRKQVSKELMQEYQRAFGRMRAAMDKIQQNHPEAAKALAPAMSQINMG